MNVRNTQFLKSIIFLPLVLSLLILSVPGEAEAFPPDICITSPHGMPFYNPGQTIIIRYESSNFGTHPDHDFIFALNFYYQWDGGVPIWIGDAHPLDIAGGTKNMTAPASAGINRLKIIARYELDGGGIASEAVSDWVRIVPEDRTSHWINTPNPTPATTCFDTLVIPGGSTQVVGWNLSGCSTMGSDNELIFSYSTNGVSYTPFITINDPCDRIPAATWEVPEVNTSSAKMELTWQRTSGALIGAFTSTYPFTITTEDINEPPVADLGPDRTVFSGERVLMGGCTTDPDGDTLSYEWTRIDSLKNRYPVDLYASNICTRSFTAPCVNFEITMAFKIAIEDGHHLPVTDEIFITVQPSPDDLDGDCADSSTDNCPTVANPDQADFDHDGVGDVCDNCWQQSNASQTDSDGDWKGNECDPCPYDVDDDIDGDGHCANVDNCDERANVDQADWDGDGEGDSCDCDDGYSGPYERTADCGIGCPDPCSDDACQPLIYNGPSRDRIDVVLIPADDYFSTWPEMANPYHFAIKDAIEDFTNSFLADPTIGSATNRRKFNLWYTNATVADTWMNSEARMRWDAEDWKEDCPAADIGFVMHVARWRDYSSGDVFSTDRGSIGTMLHEAGHSLFDFGDEYDDGPGCSTHYHQVFPSSRSNIWSTDNRCEYNSTLPDADCHRFTTCQYNWYKAHPDGVPTMMNGCENSTAGSYPFIICDWGPDALRQVEHVLGEYSGTSAMAASSPPPGDDDDRALVVKFHYDGVTINLVKAKLVFGGAPERRFEREGLRLKLLDENGLLLSEFSIHDPRYIDYAEDPLGGELQKEVVFSEVFPFSLGASTIQVIDVPSGTMIGEFDITPLFNSFCGQYPNDPACICEGNLDSDGDQDGSDSANFSYAFGNKDYEADINRDQQINSNDVSLFATDYGRENCPDDNWPDCNDKNPCTQDYYDPEIKECVYEPIRCDDDSMCTGDTCDPKIGCIFTPVNCDDGDSCTVDSCEPVHGECINTPRNCDDNNSCTNDFCDQQTGSCRSKTIICNDNNDYTVDQCDPVSGCFSYPMPCDDNDPCTIDTIDLQTGECVSVPACNDKKLCTDDYCDQKTGECSFVPIVCDQDNDLCTIAQCTENTGKCVTGPVNCDDKDPCTIDTCGPKVGCIHTPTICK